MPPCKDLFCVEDHRACDTIGFRMLGKSILLTVWIGMNLVETDPLGFKSFRQTSQGGLIKIGYWARYIHLNKDDRDSLRRIRRIMDNPFDIYDCPDAEILFREPSGWIDEQQQGEQS